MANMPHQIWIRLGLDGSLEHAMLQEYDEHLGTFDDVRAVSSSDWPKIMSAVNTAAMQKAICYDALREEHNTAMKRLDALEKEKLAWTVPETKKLLALLFRLEMFVSNERNAL